jgi:AcrR family transcriptional regulator
MLQTPIRYKLPRGSSSLPKEVVEAEQKKRLVKATAAVVAAKGYASTSVADIIAAAGVSRATFYSFFSNKEECFLFGYRKLSNAHVGEAERVIKTDQPLPERLRSALSTYLRRIDADQELAVAFVAEVEGATVRCRRAVLRVQNRMLQVLQSWLEEVYEAHPEVARSSPENLILVSSGLHGFVIRQVRSGKSFDAPQVDIILRFLFAALHLYTWAHQADQEIIEAGKVCNNPLKSC